MKHTPNTLTTLTRRVVNSCINNIGDIRVLEIPNCLKNELREYYIKDCLYCIEKIDFSEKLVREASVAPFDEPFADVGADRYLLYRNWKWRYGIPKFSWEVNHVVHCFYKFGCEFDNGYYHEEEERYCRGCAREPSFARSISTHVKKTVLSQIVRACDLIDEIFKASNHWCSGCDTRALFYIEEYDEEDTWLNSKKSWRPLKN